MDALDVDVTVRAESTHDLVSVEIENYSTNDVAVRLTQPCPAGVSASQLAVPPQYDTSQWSENAESLVFLDDIDWGDSIETGYAVTDLDRETIRELCREMSIEIRDKDGTDLGTLTDVTPAFADGPSDPGLGGRTDSGGLGGTVATGGQVDDIEAELNGTIDILKTPPGESRSGETVPSESEMADTQSANPETAETQSGDTQSGDTRSSQTHSSGTLSGDSRPPDSGGEDTRSTDAHSQDSGGDPTGTEAGDLPARITDYVLEDVDDGVSASDFSWRAVGPTGPDAPDTSEPSEGPANGPDNPSEPSEGPANGPDSPSDPESGDTTDSSSGFFGSLLAWF